VEQKELPIPPRTRSLLLACLILLEGSTPRSAFGHPKESLDRDPPISTSFADALPDVAFLDDFAPRAGVPLTILQRTADGGFLLDRPGYFLFHASTYCLSPGKASPGDEGYLWAPVRGPWADILRSLLEGSAARPEVSREDVQVLIWGMVTRTSLRDMSSDIRRVAALLLTPKQLYRLNGGARGLVPEWLLDKILEKLPPEIQSLVEAEARLREMLTDAYATYEELEDMAVLRGKPSEGEILRAVPRKRWSFHPDGYFLRIRPDGYSEALIEVHLPEDFETTQDGRGRVVSVAAADGRRIDLDYADSPGSQVVEGEAVFEASAFRSIRFEQPHPKRAGERRLAEWSGCGWTLVGVPHGAGRPAPEAGRFAGLAERYAWSEALLKETESLLGEPAADAPGEIIALGHLAAALEGALADCEPEPPQWALRQLQLLREAWQSAVASTVSSDGTARGLPGGGQGLASARAARGFGTSAPSHLFPISPRFAWQPPVAAPGAAVMASFSTVSSKLAATGGSARTFNPASGVAASSHSGRQDLAVSGSSSERDQKCSGDFNDCMNKAREYDEECRNECAPPEPDPDCFESCNDAFDQGMVECDRIDDWCRDRFGKEYCNQVGSDCQAKVWDEIESCRATCFPLVSPVSPGRCEERCDGPFFQDVRSCKQDYRTCVAGGS